MKKLFLLLVVSTVICLSGCTPANQATVAVTPSTVPAVQETKGAEQAENDSFTEMDQAFGEMIRSDGSVLAAVDYNGAGKLAVYYREFKDKDAAIPSKEYWDQSCLPEGLIAEKPEDVLSVIVINLTAQAYGLTSIEEKVGDPVEQRTVYDVAFYNPQSWRSSFREYFFGKMLSVGSYTIDWQRLSLPDANEVSHYIEQTIKKYEALPVSKNWQAYDQAFETFVFEHFDFGGEWEGMFEDHHHNPNPSVAYNGAGKYVGCFFDHEEKKIYWTDAFIPDEVQAESPEEVSSIWVVQQTNSESAIIYRVPLGNVSTSCRGLATFNMNEFQDFTAYLNAVKESIPYTIMVDEPGPYIEFVHHVNTTPSHITVRLKNVSAFDYVLQYFYPDRLWLERYESGEWQPMTDDPIADRRLYVEDLPVGCETELQLEWKEKYGELEPGKYRMTLSLSGEKLPKANPSIRFDESFEIEFSVQ